MGELFAEFGDIVFTLVISYISAIEFLYVVRHLYHYSFNHDAGNGVDESENLSQLQDSMRQQLTNAINKEGMVGTQLMKDGVPYKDGFRLEAQQALIDQLKAQLRDKELSDLRRQELEKELAKQIKIADKLRKELTEAEEKYQRQLRKEEDATAKKLQAERDKKEAEEQARKLAEAEKQREAEQRKREEEERIKKGEKTNKERQQRKEQEKKEAEEQERMLAEAEKQREFEQRQSEEAEQRKRDDEDHIRKEEEQKENERRLIEAEKQRELEQRQREEAEENIRKLQEAERLREYQQRKLEEELEIARLQAEKQEIAEAKENAWQLREIEKANEEKQAAEEAAAELDARNLLAIEHRLEDQLRAAEKEAELTEKERQLIDSIKKRDLREEAGNKHKEAELLKKILQAREQLGEESEEEQTFRLIQRERDQEAKQKRIEENALLFLEAEKEMAELQSKMLDAVERREYSGNLDSVPHTPVVEEPCIKRNFSPLSAGESSHSTVKTQLAQDLTEPYSVRTKPLLFPGVSDDTSSIDPASSQQSSFSTQPSEDITTGTDTQYPYQERLEPDGEDTALSNMQYSDDYLRSLDGIKQRPLVREDGSGRRRAFKKRRSSNSSNSSRDSRHSRDEELKMFTSLEEEEMKDNADSEFKPIRYSTEPTLKVKGHHRRHKRSPAKDMRRGDDSLRSSLERLGQETSDPWGELKPEQYKNTEFWKREKTLSIDEELEFEKQASSEDVTYDTASNMPNASSFEEATEKQNKEALTVLTAVKKQSSKRNVQEEIPDDPTVTKEEPARSDTKNLQTSQKTEKEKSSARSSATPRLRRSPRVEEVDQYEEQLKAFKDKTEFTTAQNTPTINVESPMDFGPWRDEYGLMMQGLSDFYDFTASVNPSRSRPTSRNVSPANTAPNTPQPKNVSFQINISNEKAVDKTTIDVYDDTRDSESRELKKENIVKFIESLNDNENKLKEENTDDKPMKAEAGLKNHLYNVADDASKSSSNQMTLIPLVNIIDDAVVNNSPNLEEETESGDAAMNALLNSLRSQQGNRSRSRSKSPLPTPDNLKRSVENRRYKMIKHNEDVLEKLIESKLLPELVPPEQIEENSRKGNNQTAKFTEVTENENISQEQTSCSIQSLHVERRRSRSKSPMRLPTAENLSKGLEKRRNKLIERNDEILKQIEERSQTPDSPTIVVEHVYEIESSGETLTIDSFQEENDCSKEKIDLLVQSLRVARSKTRSKSPMRVNEIDTLSETTEAQSLFGFQHTENVENTQHDKIVNVPSISIAFSETETEAYNEEVDGNSREKMDLLVQSLREARSKSVSKSPMRLTSDNLMQHMKERAKTPEIGGEIATDNQRSRYSRSRSPSRSHSLSPAAHYSSTPSRSLSPHFSDHDNLNLISNLKESLNSTLTISTEEQESSRLAHHQRQLDEEALNKLRTASEEMELKTLSPLLLEGGELCEEQSKDYLAELHVTERAKLLRKTPTTPDYNRTISEEMRDVERIKQEMLQKGFKRSTYIGESMDLGSEFVPLRREAAKFQRSHSPSPSFSKFESATAQIAAEESRKIQELILQELTTSSKEVKSTGAIPKTERLNSCDIELSLNEKEQLLSDSSQHIANLDDKTETFEELRRRNAAFRRSASASRSPLHECQLEELASIESEAAKRTFKDKILDEVSCTSLNFFDNDRRASDPVFKKVPDILVQLKDDVDLEPEEYHHYRRYSLAQEEPIEQYPGDDYIFIQQVEVRTRSGSRTWLREDFYSENVEEFLGKGDQSQGSSAKGENTESVDSKQTGNEPSDSDYRGNDFQEEEILPGAEDDEEYSNASDDDRQTVVEVDDEIDEDISDFNERGPAEESHHETSECEEAEREMDHYAGREASDWNQVVNGGDIITENCANEEDEGAVGGSSTSPYDSDSLAIDQIYDEAIKDRKQSGILREYDSILMQISSNSDIDEQYLLWSKTRSKQSPKNIEFNSQFLDIERKESEMRYLGDSNVTARQSARLRSRYGYSPVLQAKCIEDDLQVDLNYKPKREYNWRKNFKLDEDIVKEDKEITLKDIYFGQGENDNRGEEQWNEIFDSEEKEQIIDERKFSLGGESVILFSRSPEWSLRLEGDQCEVIEKLNVETFTKEEVREEKLEKPKKKKTKKKSHKESKTSLVETMNREDEDAYDNQVYGRRSSSIQIDTDSPKRKSRSRRSSKSSLINEDTLGLFSQHSSIAYNETYTMEELTEVPKETVRPKKMKKRKKVKETMADVAENPTKNTENFLNIVESLSVLPAVSTVITPESSSVNILSTLSPENSVCVTPASIDSVSMSASVEELRENYNETAVTSFSTTSGSPAETISRTSSINTTQVDTFDILKDANFYPLF